LYLFFVTNCRWIQIVLFQYSQAVIVLATVLNFSHQFFRSTIEIVLFYSTHSTKSTILVLEKTLRKSISLFCIHLLLCEESVTTPNALRVRNLLLPTCKKYRIICIFITLSFIKHSINQAQWTFGIPSDCFGDSIIFPC